MLRITRWIYDRHEKRVDAESDDYALAQLEAQGLIEDILDLDGSDETRRSAAAAEEIVFQLTVKRPDLMARMTYPSARRVWYYLRDHVNRDKWIWRGGDEYGNRTLVVHVPFAGAVVLATGLRHNKLPERLDVEPAGEWLDVEPADE
ncbi:MAG: hypothetical protein WC054_00655 [Candidatus Nanopelagicales bacterium]